MKRLIVAALLVVITVSAFARGSSGAARAQHIRDNTSRHYGGRNRV